jgi:hypothetical protein
VCRQIGLTEVAAFSWHGVVEVSYYRAARLRDRLCTIQEDSLSQLRKAWCLGRVSQLDRPMRRVLRGIRGPLWLLKTKDFSGFLPTIRKIRMEARVD